MSSTSLFNQFQPKSGGFKPFYSQAVLSFLLTLESKKFNQLTNVLAGITVVLTVIYLTLSSGFSLDFGSRPSLRNDPNIPAVEITDAYVSTGVMSAANAFSTLSPYAFAHADVLWPYGSLLTHTSDCTSAFCVRFQG